MRRTYSNNISFLDLLFNFLLATTVLLVIAVCFIITEKNEADIKTKAEFVITMTWNEDYNNDVDIWVQDPLENLLWFRKKEVGLMHLDRDDVGNRDDITISGEVIKINQEIVTIRGNTEGEWIINVHLYKQRIKQPTNVKVTLIKLNPKAILIFCKELQLIEFWQQVTLARLIMSESGEILQIDNGPFKDLIQERIKPS